MVEPEESDATDADLDRQLRELKARSLLAGTLAHDFNNLLTTIGGHAALLEAGAEPGSDVRESAVAILRAVEHGGAIARKLAGLSRPRREAEVAVDLNSTVAEVAALLRPISGKTIEIREELLAPEASTIADPGEMHQLVLNLALNARESMPEGGRLTIETRLEGPHVVLTVRDTGAGIDPEVRDHIFEPFVSTKNGDCATGLGLSAVAGIVERNGGFVRVESQPGEGSTFRVYLPLASRQRARGAG